MAAGGDEAFHSVPWHDPQHRSRRAFAIQPAIRNLAPDSGMVPPLARILSSIEGLFSAAHKTFRAHRSCTP
jgi:hypothetical protein